MEETKTVRTITEWNPIGMRCKTCPKNRWKDEVLNGLKKLKVKNWMYLVKDRKPWHELVQKNKTRNGLQQRQRRQKKKKTKTRRHVILKDSNILPSLNTCAAETKSCWKCAGNG
jgi:hypothetical protein